jgi:NAD(P)-dependent dehydrogenase (short-subunit alcohol dehydrogenase family)
VAANKHCLAFFLASGTTFLLPAEISSPVFYLTQRVKEATMAKPFEGKVALITGGASGIGRATALAFSREGAEVVVADVNAEGGEETVRLIKENGGEASFVKCDVSRASDVEGMVSKAVEEYGRLDCAFNNAGVGVLKSVVECTEEDWDLTMNVNLKGVWLCMKHEMLHMLKQGSGAIVNTSSAAGLMATQGHAPYTASKHGVVALTKVGALDGASFGVRVNAVCPGGVLTPMLEPLLEAEPHMKEVMKMMHPLRRIGKPEEIAAAVIWLCSDAASFVTGVAFPVDGGVLSGQQMGGPEN